MKTLKDAKVGETVRVKKLYGEGPVKRRIMDMGITKGTSSFCAQGGSSGRSGRSDRPRLRAFSAQGGCRY